MVGSGSGSFRRTAAAATERSNAGSGPLIFALHLSRVYKGTLRASMAKPKSERNDLLQGTLDLLVLKTVALGPQHGWGISQRIRQISRDVFQVNQGSLYPALHRLEERGWVSSEWGVSEANRQAKFYRLTRAGERQLAKETENWAELASGVARILDAK
jgi:PadR family transcriptional regulator PadR